MKVTVKMSVSEKLAILENKPTAGIVALEVETNDLTQEEREELVTLERDNAAVYIAYDRSRWPWSWGKEISEATLENFRAALASHRLYRLEREQEDLAKKAKMDSDTRDRISEWLSDPKKWIDLKFRAGSSSINYYVATAPSVVYGNPLDLRHYKKELPELQQALQDAESLAFWVNLDRDIRSMREDRIEREKKAREEAEAEALAERKAGQIAAWVAEKGTENQKSRFADGYLPEEEILDSMREEAFAPLAIAGMWERYKKLRKSDVCAGIEYEEGGYHDEVEFEVEDAATMSAEEYERLLQARALMPHAGITVRRHTATCGTCDTEVTRSGLMVRVRVGKLSFSREYAL